MNTSIKCECDVDYSCDVPECVAKRDEDRQRYVGTYTPRPSREEWMDVFQDRPDKAASFDRFFGEQ